MDIPYIEYFDINHRKNSVVKWNDCAHIPLKPGLSRSFLMEKKMRAKTTTKAKPKTASKTAPKKKPAAKKK